MAGSTSPIFIAVPAIGKGLLDTANTNRDGTGTIVTLLTAGSNGTKVNSINIKASAQPADSTIMFYVYDGATYYAYEEWDLNAPAAGSATLVSYQERRAPENLVLASGWSLRASITATPTSGKVHVTVHAGDY